MVLTTSLNVRPMTFLDSVIDFIKLFKTVTAFTGSSPLRYISAIRTLKNITMEKTKEYTYEGMANSNTDGGLGNHLTAPPSKKKRKKRKRIHYKNNTLINNKVDHLT